MKRWFAIERATPPDPSWPGWPTAWCYRIYWAPTMRRNCLFDRTEIPESNASWLRVFGIAIWERTGTATNKPSKWCIFR